MSRNGREPKSPAFQWYPTDFLSHPKVIVMSTTEVGAYALMLNFSWLENGLENDHAALAELCRMTFDEFERAWKHVGKCWRLDSDGRLRNPRQERERQFQVDNRQRLTELSKLGVKARGRHKKNNAVTARSTDGDAPNAHTRTQRPYPTPNTQSPTPGVTKGAAPPPDPFAELPSMDTPETRAAFERWGAYRREAKLRAWAPATLRASLAKFEPAGPLAWIRAVDDSISNGHQGVFLPKNGTPPKTPENSARAMLFGSAPQPRTVDVEGKVNAV